MQAYERLEIAWAEFNGLNPAGMVACASGTAALHLALEALRLPPGSSVVTGDFNMVAVPRAIAAAELTPVFVDCDERLLMDPDLINQAGASIKGPMAVVMVHVYGRRCPYWPVDGHDSANERCYLVEDLAEAHGVRPYPTTDAACWSFYRNKIVAGEEGGAVWFRDPEHAALARSLRSLGFTAAHDFWHAPRGWNHRMSNAHAELILCNLKWADELLASRRRIEALYDARCPKEWRMPARDAVWVYDMRLPDGANMNRIVRLCREAGIEARHSFKPMHLQDEFQGSGVVSKGWPRSVTESERVMYLPVQPGVTDAAFVGRAFDVIERAVG